VKGDKVLIDTSVWIKYFKNRNDQFSERVDEVLTFSDVYVPKVVIAELIQGAKSEKEISVIEEFIDAFNIIDQTDKTWVNAGRLSFSMKRKGITVNLVDCYIALLANENNCKLFSLDEHFKSIKKFLRFELFE
jgi:hypothetical protein